MALGRTIVLELLLNSTQLTCLHVGLSSLVCWCIGMTLLQPEKFESMSLSDRRTAIGRVRGPDASNDP
jgi:hypothetical protein